MTQDMMHVKLINFTRQREKMSRLKPHFGVADIGKLNANNSNLKLPIPAITTLSGWLENGKEVFGERPDGNN